MRAKISEAKSNWIVLEGEMKIAIFHESKLLSTYLLSMAKLNLLCTLQVASVCQCNAEPDECRTALG